MQAQLKSDHQHSSLSLGHISRIEDNAGRKDWRGEGFELRTDGHGVVRAKGGLLISTEARPNAQAHAKDMGETTARLGQAQDLHDSLGDLAVQHQAQEPFTAQSDLALLSEKGVLPRNINLKTFEPHRAEFVCAQAATKAPVLTPEAQELFEQGMALTSPAFWPNERNWPRAMELWDKAAHMGHWKANLMWIQTAQTGNGVNDKFGQFQVPAHPPEIVVKRVEDLMRQGVADGFYLMGNFHDTGYGVKRSVERAWAFWELAADMGSARAQTQIAKSLGFLGRDQEKPGVAEWANQPVKVQMLECALAQGYGPAGYELGIFLDTKAVAGRAINGDKEAQFARARQILHDATKFGSEDAANNLSSAFSAGDPLVMNAKDPARAARYSALGDALFNNPDLRFPNLDKVIPLPPAELPKWDGKPESLIDAAKGVRATPKLPQSSSSLYPANHRAHQPIGTALTVPPHLANIPALPGFTSVLADRPGSTGLARAVVAGYWQAQPLPATAQDSPYVSSLRSAFGKVPPLRFEEGERMQLTVDNSNLPHEDVAHSLVTWHFVGWSAPMHAPQDWLAKAGTVRAIDAATGIGCPGDQVCIATGIWQPHVLDAEHPLHTLFGTVLFTDAWKWQAFVQEGQPMPSLQAMGLPIEDAQVDWRLMQRTALGFDV